MTRTLAEQLASGAVARHNCYESGNHEWYERHDRETDYLAREFMPSGSGFDNGTSIDLDRSHATRLVFVTAYHHMSEHGYYDGWTEHKVIVTPSFLGFDIHVTGHDRNDIKDYIVECFHAALSESRDHVEWHNLAA